ncbi:hypothetical protein R1sor_026428 [Riccia sorocarpa]|uniref:Cytochrome P450 n=1 Tax=Riccia sorocarpa TaxID=122646 RepID=A0ABD3GEM7_9MARC
MELISTTAFFTAVASIVLYACVYRWILQRNFRGPKGWPVVGNALELLVHHREIYDRLTDYYPTFRCRILPRNFVVTVDPENVEYIYCRPPPMLRRPHILRLCFGDCTLSQDSRHPVVPTDHPPTDLPSSLQNPDRSPHANRIRPPTVSDLPPPADAHCVILYKTNFNNFWKGETEENTSFDVLGYGIFNSHGEAWKKHWKVGSHEFTSRKLRGYSSQNFKAFAVQLCDILQEAANNDKVVSVRDMAVRMSFESIYAKFLGIGPEARLKRHIKDLGVFTHELVETRIAEIESNKKKENSGTSSALLDRYAVTNKLHYVQATLYESMRLRAGGPLNYRVPIKDDVLPTCGTKAGPRWSMGKDSAVVLLMMALATVYRFFTFELVPGEKVHYRFGITHIEENGLKMIPRKRS